MLSSKKSRTKRNKPQNSISQEESDNLSDSFKTKNPQFVQNQGLISQ